MLLTHDCPSFFKEEILRTFNLCDNIVMVGDYNTVMNLNYDRNSGMRTQSNNRNATKQICDLIDELSLDEIWRTRNPDVRRYSWYRTIKSNRSTILQASRLDYAVISTALSNKVHNCMYLAGIKTDHSAFFIGFELQYIDRGKSFWKLNTKYLSDIEYVKMMNNEIEQCINRCGGLNPSAKWECVKRHIRKTSKTYAKQKCFNKESGNKPALRKKWLKWKII